MQPVTEQHEWLQQTVGDWDVKCFYFVEEGAPPMEAGGTERTSMIGSFWRESFFSADILGSRTDGRMLVGYDPSQRCFVGTWCDSSNPFLYRYTGQLDEGRTSLELVGENIDPTSGQMAKYRSLEKIESSQNRSLELFVRLSEGHEFRVLRYQYTRK